MAEYDVNDLHHHRYMYRENQYRVLKFMERQAIETQSLSVRLERLQHISDYMYGQGRISVGEEDALALYEVCVQLAIFWIIMACKIDASMQEVLSWETDTIFTIAPWFILWRPGEQKVSDIDESMNNLEAYASLYYVSPSELRDMADRGNWFHMASSKERLSQLSEVAEACDFLAAVDLVDLAHHIKGEIRGETEYADYAVLGCEALQHYILPLALATLHTWRGHVKANVSGWQSGQELTYLWRCYVQVFASAHPIQNTNDLNLRPKQFESLLGGDVNDTAQLCIDKPIAQMSMREHWATLQMVIRRTPTMVIARGLNKLVSLLVWRLASIISVQDDTETFDMMIFAVPVEYSVDYGDNDDGQLTDSNELVSVRRCDPERALLQANDKYLKDTEYMCEDLMEMCRVWRFLEHPYNKQRRVGGRGSRVAWPPDRFGWEVPQDIEENWIEYVKQSTMGSVKNFIERSLTNFAWGHYKYWGEEERYMSEQGVKTFRMRQVVAQYRKEDYDTVDNFLKSNLPLSTVYENAVQHNHGEWDDIVNRHDGQKRPEREGFCWQSIWDVEKRLERERLDAIQNNRIEGLENITPVPNDSTGEIYFVDNRTKRRLRGNRLREAEARYQVNQVPAGSVERYLIELYTINSIFMGDANTAGKFYIQDQYAATEKQFYSIDALCGSTTSAFSGVPSSQEAPNVVFSCGKFVVIASNRTLYVTHELFRAAYYWSLYVELGVRRKLHHIATKLQRHPDDMQSRRSSIQAAQKEVIRIPMVFRILFHLERNENTAQIESEHDTNDDSNGVIYPRYNLPQPYINAYPCQWDNMNISSHLV